MTKTIGSLLFLVFYFSGIITYLAPEAAGQHHGAPPPSADIGNRKISLNFATQPNPIMSGQNAMIKIAFADEGTKQNVNHVTFRMDISKDGKRLLSEFFHGHEGEINISFKDNNKAGSYTIGGNQDILTNAWVPDPGSPITVRGGQIFLQNGLYKTIVEVTTLDNDKTDLPKPIKYEFNLSVS